MIEVGVDVPNASLMIVEGADRFGLAQLHQLRGRVGRGAGASACLLLHGTPSALPSEALRELEAASPSEDLVGKKAPRGKSGTEDIDNRLGVLAQTSNGFQIAEADLRLRGPGEVLGTRQAGLPPLRYADLLRDIDLLQVARREAAALLVRDPELAQPAHAATQRQLRARWAAIEEDATLE